jgi:hypothetical protein
MEASASLPAAAVAVADGSMSWRRGGRAAARQRQQGPQIPLRVSTYFDLPLLRYQAGRAPEGSGTAPAADARARNAAQAANIDPSYSCAPLLPCPRQPIWGTTARP